MKELPEILDACRNESAAGRPSALATVVKVEGSAYRRPGARMLVASDGSRIGSVSGGCLEADVALHAHQVAETGVSEYVLYDARTSNGDVVAELGCKGAVGVLIEPADRPCVLASLQFLAGFARERGEGAQVTVFRVEGDCPVHVGDRLMQRGQGAPQGDSDAPDLTRLLLPHLAQAVRERQAQTRTLSFPAGSAEALIEPARSPISLLLFGAGQDAVPLAQMASLLGWQVTIVDHRPSMLSSERFSGIRTLLVSRPEQRKELLVPDARTAAVIMSHNYLQDLAWLRHLLPSPLRYIGLLGPRKRADQMRADLGREGIAPNSEVLSRLYSPTGLDIGSETPEEIALAILAEIQAAMQDRSGGFLRERKGPIHIALN
jgi:xanthine dehydrogenase accessory factor